MTITTSFAIKLSNKFSSRIFNASNPVLPNSLGWPSEKLTKSGSAIASSRDLSEKLKQSRNAVLAVLIAYKSSLFLPSCYIAREYSSPGPNSKRNSHEAVRPAQCLIAAEAAPHRSDWNLLAYCESGRRCDRVFGNAVGVLICGCDTHRDQYLLASGKRSFLYQHDAFETCLSFDKTG